MKDFISEVSEQGVPRFFPQQRHMLAQVYKLPRQWSSLEHLVSQAHLAALSWCHWMPVSHYISLSIMCPTSMFFPGWAKRSVILPRTIKQATCESWSDVFGHWVEIKGFRMQPKWAFCVIGDFLARHVSHTSTVFSGSRWGTLQHPVHSGSSGAITRTGARPYVPLAHCHGNLVLQVVVIDTRYYTLWDRHTLSICRLRL